MKWVKWIIIKNTIVLKVLVSRYTAQKMKFYIKDFFSKCDQIRRKLRIWSHLLKKSLMQNFIFCAVLKAFKSPSSHQIWLITHVDIT